MPVASQGTCEDSTEADARVGRSGAIPSDGVDGARKSEAEASVYNGQGRVGKGRTKRGKRGGRGVRGVESEKAFGKVVTGHGVSVKTAAVGRDQGFGKLGNTGRVLESCVSFVDLRSMKLEKSLDFRYVYESWYGFFSKTLGSTVVSSELQVLAKCMLCQFVAEHEVNVDVVGLLEFVGKW